MVKRHVWLIVLLLGFCAVESKAQVWYDVDTALAGVPVNKFPVIIADGTIDDGVTYDEAGMDLNWNFTTTGGVTTQTNVTPTTTNGVHDWVSLGNGMYTIEIPATGGTINNDTEGFGWWSGDTTATLVFGSWVYGFRAASVNDSLVDDVLLNVQDIADGHDAGSADSNTVVAAVAAIITDLTTALTRLNTIITDTAELQGDWANGGRLDLLLDTAAAGGLVEAQSTTVNTVTSSRIFTLAAGVQNNNAYRYHIISVQDATDSHWEVRTVRRYIGSSRQVTLNLALTFTPVNGDVVHIAKGAYMAPTKGGIY